MKKVLSIVLILMLFISCKNDNKGKKTTNKEPKEIEKEKQEERTKTFMNDLIDYREIDRKFNQEYTLKSFGMNRINDSVYAYVFKLSDDTPKTTVESLSIGVKAYSDESEKPITSSYSPEIKTKDDGNYIIMPRNFQRIKYLDSIEFYTYARNKGVV